MFQSMLSPYRHDTGRLCLHIVVFPTYWHSMAIQFEYYEIKSINLSIYSILLKDNKKSRCTLIFYINGKGKYLHTETIVLILLSLYSA